MAVRKTDPNKGKKTTTTAKKAKNKKLTKSGLGGSLSQRQKNREMKGASRQTGTTKKKY
jgi:hypothetical protein